jgi:hypothetical protein
MHAVFEQAIAKARSHVINQVRFNYSMQYLAATGADSNELYRQGETTSDEMVIGLLGPATMLSNFKLAELAGKITLEDLFSPADWVDGVADYIVENQAECTPVWDFLRHLVDHEKEMSDNTSNN